jgi:chromosome partitioning protein
VTRIVAIANQKGGVGKTTTAVNLAASLAAAEQRVLLVDLDPQGNASSAFGIDKARVVGHIYPVLLGGLPLAEAIHPTALPQLRVVPATTDLAGAEVELVTELGREGRLKEALAGLADTDWVIIDCPPSLGLLTLNALNAADSVLIPLQCEFYALEGMSHLLGTLDLIKARLNPRLAIEGIVLTMFDRRNKLSFQVERDVTGYFGDLVFTTRIPRNVRLSESPSFGKPALLYDITAPGTTAYLELAAELLDRTRRASAGAATQDRQEASA